MSKDISDQVIGMVRTFRKQGVDPLRDLAVITPQKTGHGGTWELNTILAKELNPGRKPIAGVERGKFDDVRMPLPHIGDRVMFTDNDKDIGVVNGDVGIIQETYPDLDNPRRNLIKVKLDDGRSAEIPTTRWRDLILAYAITCHKSQGSQYPVVILPFSDMHRGMAQRTLVYTAWTRAKKMVIGVGERSVFKEFVETNTSHDRYTILRRLTELLFQQKKIKPRGSRAEPLPYLSPSDRVVETTQKAAPQVVRPRVSLSMNRSGPKVAARKAVSATPKPQPVASESTSTAPSVVRNRPQIKSGLIGKRKVTIGKPQTPAAPQAPSADQGAPAVVRPKVSLGRGYKTSRTIKVAAPSPDGFKP